MSSQGHFVTGFRSHPWLRGFWTWLLPWTVWTNQYPLNNPFSARTRQSPFLLFVMSLPGWYQFSAVQSLSCVRLFATPCIAAHQASLSIINSQTLLALMSTESVMPSNHLTLCRSILLPPSIFPSIRVFLNESVLRIRWPKYWSFSFSYQSFQWRFRTDFL